MSKKETFFVRLMVCAVTFAPLYGDISVGIVKGIDNNTKVRLLYNNVSISCEPFGVIPLEKMVAAAPAPQECAKQIEAFYRISPHDKVFAKEHLRREQSYHFELIKEGCVLYANGQETYSEMLLSRGIAIVDPKFNNGEWNGRLARAQRGAENQQTGLSATPIRKFCIKEEKK